MCSPPSLMFACSLAGRAALSRRSADIRMPATSTDARPSRSMGSAVRIGFLGGRQPVSPTRAPDRDARSATPWLLPALAVSGARMRLRRPMWSCGCSHCSARLTFSRGLSPGLARKTLKTCRAPMLGGVECRFGRPFPPRAAIWPYVRGPSAHALAGTSGLWGVARRDSTVPIWRRRRRESAGSWQPAGSEDPQGSGCNRPLQRTNCTHMFDRFASCA